MRRLNIFNYFFSAKIIEMGKGGKPNEKEKKKIESEEEEFDDNSEEDDDEELGDFEESDIDHDF